MDLDDLDIYEDLDSFQKEEEKKTGELLSLEAKYNDSLKTIDTLQVENAKLQKQIRKMLVSFQSLLDTAKTELKRKDKEIGQLHQEKDDICFRRKQPRRDYSDLTSTSEYSNAWLNNESELPVQDFGSNTNTNIQRSKETIETKDREHPCTTSLTTSGHENTQIRDEYKKTNHRDERYGRKYDYDPQREKYNRSNSQKDQQESRYKYRKGERDESYSWGLRDYRSRRDELDTKYKPYKTEKEWHNNTDNGRRQHNYDRLGDRLKYHSKEEKTKSGRYDGLHNRRSDIKKYREDTNKKCKETNEKVSEINSDACTKSDDIRGKQSKYSEINLGTRTKSDEMRTKPSKSPEINLDVCPKSDNMRGKPSKTSERNLDVRTKSDDMRGKPSKSLESKKENKSNESQKLNEGSHKDTKRNETVTDNAFLDKNLPALKDSKHLKKDLAEEMLIKEKLLVFESELPCTKTDKNANHLTPANVMTSPKETALADELFESTPTNEPNESSAKSFEMKRKVSESAKPEEIISCSYSENLVPDNGSSPNFDTSVKVHEERVDYAKIAKMILSDKEDQTEIERKVEIVSVHEEEPVYNATKTNGNKKKGGIKILENIRLPNIYEIRAHQRRLREAAAAKEAKRALTAKTKDTKQNATQNTKKMTATLSADFSKEPQKNAENNKGACPEEGYVETKTINDEYTIGDPPQLNADMSIDSNTKNNETTLKETSSDTTHTADHATMQGIKNEKLLVLVEKLFIVNSENIVDDAALKQMEPETEDSIRLNNDEKSKEIPIAEKIVEVELKQEFNVHCQNNTDETISTEVNTKDLTVEIAAEELNIVNETKFDPTSIKSNIKLAASPTPDSRNEECQSNDMRLKSTTETEQKPTKKDTPDKHSDLLTKVMPDNTKPKKSTVESKENIPKSNPLDKSAENVSQNSKRSENDAYIASAEEVPAQPIVSDENINSLFLNVAKKKSCEQIIDTEQEKSAELKELDAQNMGASQEACSQDCKKLLESVNNANESVAEAHLVTENPNSKRDMVLSTDKREKKCIDVISEQKLVEQSGAKVVEQKAVVESAVHKSEKLLQSTDTNNEGSSVIENCRTKSSAIMVPDGSKSTINATVKSECSTNVKLSNDNISTTQRDISAITESGTNTNAVAIEKSESTNRNNICAETNTVRGDESELLINKMCKPTNSYLEKNETITKVPDVLNTEPKSTVKSKEVEIHPRTVKNSASTCHRSKTLKSSPKVLSNAVNNLAETAETMKRAEVWKFKIPRFSVKRKREESADDTNAKECENTGTDVVKREKLCNIVEVPKQKKSPKLIPKEMQEETKVLEINVNLEKNLLETKTLFEDQKKSERIIKDIDNWARRKVGEPAEILETEIKIESTPAHKKSSIKHETMSSVHSKVEIPTDMKVLNTHIKEKTDKHKARRDNSDKNSESCYPEDQQEHKKPSKEVPNPSNKSDLATMVGQNSKIQERRKSHSKGEHEDCTHGSKPQNVKCGMDFHTEKSQTNVEKNAKSEQKLVTKGQRGELKTQKVESFENENITTRKELESRQDKSKKCSHTPIENDTVKKSYESRELEIKSMKSVHTNIEKENKTVNKVLQNCEKEEKSKNGSNKDIITTKSQDEPTSSSKIVNVSDFVKESTDNLNQKKENYSNKFAAKTKTIEKVEKDADYYEKRAKTDISADKKENVRKEIGIEVSSTKPTQVAISTNDALKDIIIASGSNTESTKDSQSTAATFSQAPKRGRTVADAEPSASSDDSEAIPRKRKCQMRTEDIDGEEETNTPSTTISDAPELRDIKPVDSERNNTDIIDILQNYRPNESSDNLPTPQTPTSLPANISQDAAYEEIDSRLKLMFASPKLADKTATTNRPLAAHQVEDCAVERCATGTDAPPEIDASVTEAPVGDTKPPADFNITNTFLSDISANSFNTSEMNVTINETNHSGVNATTSFNESDVSTKHISLGSSDYRFEKVSENVVNLFITRRRRGKRKSTATISTNTVSAP